MNADSNYMPMGMSSAISIKICNDHIISPKRVQGSDCVGVL